MLLSLSRIRWWGEKKPNRGEGDCSQLLEKLFVHSHSWWRLSTHPLRTNFNNWVQLMPLCKFSDCPFCVCSSQEFWSDWWIFADFQGTCGKCQCSGQDHQGSAWVLWQDKILWPKRITWFQCPAVWFIMTHESFVSSMGSWMSWHSSFGDHLNWVAMDNVASINAPTPSWLRISIRVSCPSAPWWHLCWGKDPGLGNLLGLKAKYLL